MWNAVTIWSALLKATELRRMSITWGHYQMYLIQHFSKTNRDDACGARELLSIIALALLECLGVVPDVLRELLVHAGEALHGPAVVETVVESKFRNCHQDTFPKC